MNPKMIERLRELLPAYPEAPIETLVAYSSYYVQREQPTVKEAMQALDSGLLKDTSTTRILTAKT